MPIHPVDSVEKGLFDAFGVCHNYYKNSTKENENSTIYKFLKAQFNSSLQNIKEIY